MTGRVFDIQRFSIGNGPGIRTTVFMKGCPLHCMWCHNPEAFEKKRQLKVNRRLCRGCGACVQICRTGAHLLTEEKHVFDGSKCVLCGKCVEACCYDCISVVGRDYTAQEIADIVMADRVYYDKSQGGVTFSGGEPTLQADFIEETAALLEGVNIYIDTCGSCDADRFRKMTELADGMLFDIKHMDNEIHHRLVGTGNERILENLELAANSGIELVVRYPMIPDTNDDEKNIEEMCRVLRRLGIERIDVSPYHDYGDRKYKDLSMHAHRFRKYTDEELEDGLRTIRRFGVVPIVI